MKHIIFFIFILMGATAFSQEHVDFDGKYQIEIMASGTKLHHSEMGLMLYYVRSLRQFDFGAGSGVDFKDIPYLEINTVDKTTSFFEALIPIMFRTSYTCQRIYFTLDVGYNFNVWNSNANIESPVAQRTTGFYLEPHIGLKSRHNGTSFSIGPFVRQYRTLNDTKDVECGIRVHFDIYK